MIGQPKRRFAAGVAAGILAVALAGCASQSSSPPPKAAQASGDVQANRSARAAKPAPDASGGKPEVLYIGAEYCPFCGAQRWASSLRVLTSRLR